MLISPRPTLKSRYPTPGTNPTIVGYRHRHGLKVEQSKPLPYIRRGYQPKSRQITRPQKTHTLRIGWDRDDREDGRRLASDPTVSLPGEEPRRKPRLQRQEAFRAPHDWEGDIVDDAALYRLGILYDGDDENAHVRESGFSLDAIIHAEPTYSIRPAKRAKRTHDFPIKENDLHLSVDFLSTYFTDDNSIAHLLKPVCDERPTWSHSGDYARLTGANRESAEPLATIQELVESSATSYSHTPVPAAVDFPDLISDTEEEDHEEFGEGGDWALVSDPGAEVFPVGGEAANSVDGAWVFVAGDDS